MVRRRLTRTSTVISAVLLVLLGAASLLLPGFGGAVPASAAEVLAQPTLVPTPTFSPAEECFNRGFNAIENGDYATAVEAYTCVIELTPEDAFAWNNRGVAYYRLGELELALADYSRAIELNPTYVLAYTNRALVYTDLGDYELAIADYSAALELDPANINIYLNRGSTYIRMGEIDAANADFEMAVDLGLPAESVYLSRGLAYEQAGDSVSAAPDHLAWVEAIELEAVEGDALTPAETQLIDMTEGRVYRYEFEAEEGQLLTFVAYSPDGLVDPLLIILDADGEALFSRDDISLANFSSIIEDYAAPYSGAYTLLVSHAGGGSEGTIKVLLVVREAD